jgi:uncharacterized protein YcaQ
MARPRLDLRAARRLFLHKHGLAAQPVGPGKGADLAAVIHDLGFVQLDSINTVARAHDLILFSRRPAYRPQHLKRLYEKDRELFEHWTHDAAVIPMAFYPHWRLRFERDAALLKSRWRNWRRDGFEERFSDVLDHIRRHGPVGSSDVGVDEKKSSGGWWDWHPSKTALEYLWRSGALTVIGRKGFQKQYDLTERVIDETLLKAEARPEPEETIAWKCGAALDRLGFATSGELSAFWDTVSPAEARRWCAQESDSGEIIEVEIACADGGWRKSFARADVLEQVTRVPEPPGRVRVLSPFDPALRDRKRAERLFDFHYRIEIFVPEAKRQFGYYVFPLLERDRVIGRIDMKAHRESDELRVRKLWPERGTRWSVARTQRLEAELERITRLAGVKHVRFDTDWLADPV